MNKNIISKVLISISIFALGISALLAISQIAETSNSSPSVLSLNKKIRILLVPGHEPNDGGAIYGKIKERDLNLQLSTEIKNILSANPNFEIIMARDQNGWNNDLKNYVTTGSTAIMSWVLNMKNKMLAKINSGQFKIINPAMKHNDATSEAVLYLYGTNKWIEENNIDLVLHIHFNNNPKYKGKPNYSGYCMYVPDSQYGNASTSRIFANYLNGEISKIENKSNMSQEKDTIISDQELIAIGNYDVLKIPSVLVEYAYIYEPMIISSDTRNIFIDKAASSTATAIESYIQNEFKK